MRKRGKTGTIANATEKRNSYSEGERRKARENSVKLEVLVRRRREEGAADCDGGGERDSGGENVLQMLSFFVLFFFTRFIWVLTKLPFIKQ